MERNVPQDGDVCVASRKVEKRTLDKAYQQEIEEDPEDEDRTAMTREEKNLDESTALGATRAEGCSAPDTGRCKCVIGAEMLVKNEEATSRRARWLQGVEPTRFRGPDYGVQESIRAVEFDWPVEGRPVTFAVYVEPGAAGPLMSKPDLKALGGAVDLEMGSRFLQRPDLTMPLNKMAAGHYEIDFLNRERKTRRQIHASEARARRT